MLSASADGNDRMFPRILALYVNDGSTVADVTYGKGVFWRHVPPDRSRVLATDIQDGVDCRDLPYKDSEIDCVVLVRPTCTPLVAVPTGPSHHLRSTTATTEVGTRREASIMKRFWISTEAQGRKPIGFCGIAEY